MSVAQHCADLIAEAETLDALVAGWTDAEARALTPFQGWSSYDLIMHLLLVDRLAALSFGDPALFETEFDAFKAGTAAPDHMVPPEDIFRRMLVYERSRVGLLDWAQLRAAWRAGLDSLCSAALAYQADRVRWFAGAMRSESLLGARQMELWGYGQPIFDARRAVRREGDQLRNVADFAVRTFAFSFANRALPVPSEKPHVRLTGPTGAVWTWNDADATNRITGSAVDFCLVATQNRNVADTALACHGAVAQGWMAIAQCITGPPFDPPAPGARSWTGPKPIEVPRR